jgi:WD40 repeat protein
VQSTKKIPLADPLDRLENLTQILFTPSGSRMISLSPNRPGPKIGPLGSWVWNLDHLKVGVEELRTPPTRILSKLSAEVNQAAFHPDGRWLILACSDKLVRIWDIETDTPQAVELAHSSAAISVSINHEGNRIFSGCRDGSIHYWNAATGEELWSSQQGGEILATAVSADGMMVLSGSSNGTARFWDAATGVAIGPAIHHADAVLSVGFRADGKLAVTGSRDRTAQVWRVPE